MEFRALGLGLELYGFTLPPGAVNNLGLAWCKEKEREGAAQRSHSNKKLCGEDRGRNS